MIIENGYKLDNSLIILALETLLEQVQNGYNLEMRDAAQQTFIEQENRIKKELFKIRNYER